MKKQRIPETDHGIQGEVTVAQYDQMQRGLRDKGWIETRALIRSGITSGHALEIGHGPGYLGLEWLKGTQGTTLTGLDISPDMHALVKRNAQEYGLTSRTEYRMGNCNQLPFGDQSFDAIFANGSLHEWSDPKTAFNEIWRVLKTGGRYFISDLRRDMNGLLRTFMWLSVRPAPIRPGLISSINAAYTPVELCELAAATKLKDGSISGDLLGVTLTGLK
ncbi:MAG: class I SAM-dependent methyltransferase [Anaerolineaceae bacterium]|nr:class I SAM-dependent methyltransferase [Anaerolineaceae bacterium]